MAKEKIVYGCNSCGAVYSRWQGQCKECGEWNTITEQKALSQQSNSKNALNARSWTNEKTKLVKFKEVKAILEKDRYDTGLPELNRALGGGIMPSSSIILSGEPGAGKSTILMQISANLNKQGKKVIYVSAEEVLEALKNRANRLELNIDEVNGIAENNVETILDVIELEKPDLVIIDSIQALYSNLVQSNIGSVSQITACAMNLNKQSKQLGYALIIIGHVTKDGSIAGPKVFEHMVDVTLKFEVEGNSNFRSITAEKNRFGGIETGFFEMKEKGLMSIDNPSNIFLPDHKEENEGSSIYIMKKGNRSLLVEIQSLIEDKSYSSPKRVVSGLDLNRLHMILALYNKYYKYNLHEIDVYASILSGIISKDPDADLPLLISLLSSCTGHIFNKYLASFGEISLSGEIRGCNMAENRIKDAYKFGFNHIIMPYANKSKIIDDFQKQNKDLNIFYVKHIKEIPEILENLNTKIKNFNQF